MALAHVNGAALEAQRTSYRHLELNRRKGAAVSFEALYAAEYERIYDAVYAYCGNRDIAYESTQEGFARAYVRWRRLQDQPWVAGWVMVTATNACKRHLRRDARELPAAVDGATREPEGERLDVIAALRALPHRQRQAAVLHYVGDLPIAEVALHMGLSEGTVKAHLWRARAALRRSLEVTDA